MLFQMVAGELPFTAMSEVELFNKIKAGSFCLPTGIVISQPCKDVISRLIQELPERRMNYEQFRKHPFVSLEPAEYLIYLERFQQSLDSSGNISVPSVRVEELKAMEIVPESEESKVEPAGEVKAAELVGDVTVRVKDIENAVGLTLSRAVSLEKAFKS